MSFRLVAFILACSLKFSMILEILAHWIIWSTAYFHCLGSTLSQTCIMHKYTLVYPYLLSSSDFWHSFSSLVMMFPSDLLVQIRIDNSFVCSFREPYYKLKCKNEVSKGLLLTNTIFNISVAAYFMQYSIISILMIFINVVLLTSCPWANESFPPPSVVVFLFYCDE